MTDPLEPPPGVGRLYRHTVRVQLADAAPDGRARLDAVARWLQDAAYDDVLDAGVALDGAWVVRRSTLHVSALPTLGERLDVETWCSGLGRTRLWAQRRTTVRGEAGGHVEAEAVWVHLDPATGRPMRLSERQLELWEPSTQGRQTKARLTHPSPPADAPATPWTFRYSDLDVAQHVNNAAYWAVLGEPPPAPFSATIEHPAAAQAGPGSVVTDGAMTWVRDAAGVVCASVGLI